MCYLHICPKWEWIASFEKLDGGLVSFGDGHICHIERIGTVLIKMFDATVRELQDVRYIRQLEKSLISVGALEV